MKNTGPLRKGQRTREEIIRRAAPVFNTRGFAGATMAEIVAAAGIEKGGLYNHFKSKDELALATFDYAVEQMEARHAAHYVRTSSRFDNLVSAIRAFAFAARERPIPGGCPLLNTAIEADDTNPEMRARVRDVLQRWRAWFSRLTHKAIESGELSPEVDADTFATMVVASLEGALMIANVDREDTAIEQAAAALESYLASKRLRPGIDG